MGMLNIGEIVPDKKKISIIAGALAICATASFGVYAYVPMAKSGGYSVTQRDVSVYRNTMATLVQVTGQGEVPSREESLKAMAITFAQYDLLKKKGIVINQDKVNTLIESTSPLKGVLKQLRASLGEEKYFYDVTLPAAIGRPFADYYASADPKAEDARKVLQNALSTSLGSAASSAGLKTQDITIANVEDSAALFEAASKSIGKPIERIVDSGTNYLIVQPKEKVENKIVATIVSVPKTAPIEFFQSEIKKSGVTMKVNPWCLYADNKFFDVPKADAKKDEGTSNATQK